YNQSMSAIAVPEEILTKYEPVIGLEVHVQLGTKTKIFCGCPVEFGAAPNTNVCPVCLGLPGALPVLSRQAVESALGARLRYTYVDLNRSGTPVIEIVSEPDMRSSDEAYAYVTELKQMIQYIGVSDCDMEKGQLRCDANVSVRLRGAEKFGTKAEIKNLNSFRFLKLAVEYEIERQIELIESGGAVVQETRLFNVESGRTVGMR